MKILAILGAFQGIVLVAYVLPSKKNRRANINFLIAILLSIIQMLLVSYVVNPNIAEGNLYLKLIAWNLPFLVPVFAYFYFRFLVGKSEYRYSDILYFIPFLLGIIAVVPYLSQTGSGPSLWENIDAYRFSKQGLFHLFFSSAVILFFSIKILSIHDYYKTEILKRYSNFEEKQLNWIRGNAIGFFVIGVTGLVTSQLQLIKVSNAVFNLTQIWTPDYLVFAPISILFYWYGYKVLQVPELFRFVADDPEKKEKYSHSTITDDDIEKWAKMLRDLMFKKKRFLNPNLKLSDVAEDLNISKQLLSQLLNQHFEQNFFDFINAYRIEAAKEKLIDPNFSHLTIQGISQESGFKSKSTFYDLFKKNTGITPKQFQKRGYSFRKSSP